MNEVNFYSGSTVKATIDDNYIRSGTLERSVGLISESLDIDTFTFYAYSESELHPILLLADSTGKVFQTSDGKYITVQADESADPTHFSVPGQRLMLYFTDDGGTTINLGEFFVEDVEAVGKALYRFRCQTILGIMNKQTDGGGVFDGNQTFSQLVSRMFSVGMTRSSYTIDEDIASQPVYGYLPYASKKENLMHLLFSYGCILIWDNGWLITTPGKLRKTIGKDAQATSPSTTKVDRASVVELTQHTYYIDEEGEREVIFSNMDDPNATRDTITTVIYDKPYSTSIQTRQDPDVGYFWPIERTANYAVFAGKGTAYSRPYIHQTTLLTAETDATSGRTVRIENEGLVTELNSKNVLQRLVNLQNDDRESGIEFYPSKTGSLYMPVGQALEFTDTFGNTRRGLVKSVKYELSHNLKYKADLSMNLILGPYGPNISQSVEFTELGNNYWTVPDGVTSIKIILGGAGDGGSGGYDGSAGRNGTNGNQSEDIEGYGGAGGAGGNAGVPGLGGKILTVDEVAVTPGDTIWIFLDEGGAGGARNGGAGSEGNPTLVEVGSTQYSSANGTRSPNGYYNPVTGNMFGGDGLDGYAGAKGGGAHLYPDDTYEFPGSIEDWQGGSDGLDDEFETGNTINPINYAFGGSGGGAAYGSDGGNGEDGSAERRYIWPGQGGKGGDALAPDQQSHGRGGNAGNGGGGGGGGGKGSARATSVLEDERTRVGFGGDAGLGSIGGQGGDGWAVILY